MTFAHRGPSTAAPPAAPLPSHSTRYGSRGSSYRLPRARPLQHRDCGLEDRIRHRESADRGSRHGKRDEDRLGVERGRIDRLGIVGVVALLIKPLLSARGAGLLLLALAEERRDRDARAVACGATVTGTYGTLGRYVQ